MPGVVMAEQAMAVLEKALINLIPMMTYSVGARFLTNGIGSAMIAQKETRDLYLSDAAPGKGASASLFFDASTLM
jgi:hypothetical protein